MSLGLVHGEVPWKVAIVPPPLMLTVDSACWLPSRPAVGLSGVGRGPQYSAVHVVGEKFENERSRPPASFGLPAERLKSTLPPTGGNAGPSKVGLVTHDPSLTGFFTLNETPSLLLTSPSSKATLYESPSVSSSRMHPPFPTLGGSTDTVPSLPLAVNLMVKTPLPDFLSCACFTAPLVPPGSLYLKPARASPVQNGFPLLFVPCGSAKVCSVGLVPSARTVSVAPLAVGSPTIVFELADSFALPTTVRLSGVLGSFTSSCVPRMV